MTWLTMLFHVHTQASFDGILPVRYILKYCGQHNIDLLTISDHDSMDLVEEAQMLSEKVGVFVIPAVEYSTDAGDIIGLFVEHYFKSRDCREVLLSIREQGGLSVLPHPMKGHLLEHIPFQMIDLIEIFNPRSSSEQNARAEHLSEVYNKPQLVGADAHFPWELGLALNYLSVLTHCGKGGWTDEDLKSVLLGSPRRFVCNQTTALSVQLSQFVKGIKHGDARLIHQSTRGIASAVVRRGRLG